MPRGADNWFRGFGHDAASATWTVTPPSMQFLARREVLPSSAPTTTSRAPLATKPRHPCCTFAVERRGSAARAATAASGRSPAAQPKKNPFERTGANGRLPANSPSVCCPAVSWARLERTAEAARGHAAPLEVPASPPPWGVARTLIVDQRSQDSAWGGARGRGAEGEVGHDGGSRQRR